MKLVPLLQSQELADLQAREHRLVKNTSAMPHELQEALDFKLHCLPVKMLRTWAR